MNRLKKLVFLALICSGQAMLAKKLDTQSDLIPEIQSTTYQLSGFRKPVALAALLANSRIGIVDQDDNSLSIINTENDQLVQKIEGLNEPIGIFVDAEGLKAYVVNKEPLLTGDWISVITAVVGINETRFVTTSLPSLMNVPIINALASSDSATIDFSDGSTKTYQIDDNNSLVTVTKTFTRE